MRGGGGGGPAGAAAAAAGFRHHDAPSSSPAVRSYRHELCFLPTTDTSNATAAAPTQSNAAGGGDDGDDDKSTVSDGSTTDDGGGHDDEPQPKQQQKPAAAAAAAEEAQAHAAAAAPLELVGGENFLSVIRTASAGHGGDDGDAVATNGDEFTLAVGPDPTVPSEGESGSCGGVVLLVDVDGQYVAIKDIRDDSSGAGAGAGAVQEAASGAQIYLLRRKRRQLLAATAAAASAPIIPPRPSTTAHASQSHINEAQNAQHQPKEGVTDQREDEKKKDGADIERGYDTDDENEDYLRQGGEQPSVARSKHSGGGGGGGGVGGLSNGSGAEYGPPEPLPRRQMRLLHRGDRVVVRLEGGHRTIRLEYHQKRKLEIDSAGTDDALMSTSVDAAAVDSTDAAADGEGNGAKVAFAATATEAEGGAGGRSPSNKLNGAPSSSRNPASPAKATGSPQKEPLASAHPHGPARGTITFQDDDDTTTTDGAVRRLIGISVAGGKQSGASSDGASTNAAVVVEAKKTDHGDAQAVGGGTRGSGSKPAAPIPAVVAAPAGATSGAPKSARRSSAQSPDQQKRFSQSPQMEGDDDDEMEEYSYLTGEVIMKDQGYVSAITGDEETDMEQSAEIAHRKRSKIEAANRALGIDTANNAIGGVTETTKPGGGPQMDGKPQARETEEDAATASAVILDAKAEKKVTIRGDSGGKAGAIKPPKAIEFPSQPSNEMPPPPSTVEVTDTAISPLPSTQRSAKNPDDEAGENVKVAATSSSPDEKKDPEVPESMDVEVDNPKTDDKAGDEKFSDAHEEPMFLTAQEKDDNDDDDSDEETRDEDNAGTGGDTHDVEMEDAQGVDAGVLNCDADSDGSDADDENEEGGALTQAYPMPTSPGTSHVDGVNTPESSPQRSHANADVDDDETTTAGPDQDDASRQSIDIYDQPTQPNPALHGFAEDSLEKFDLDTQPFNPREASPSPGRSSQSRGSAAVALATVNEETEVTKPPNKSGNDGSGDSGGDDDDDSVTTAGSAPLLDEKKDTAKVFTTNKTEDESIPTDAAVAALSVPTSVAGDTPKPDASAPAQEAVADDEIDSDATEDENAITTEAAVGAPSALSSLPTSDAGDKPSNDNDESDSETEDENEQQKNSGGAAGNVTLPGAAAHPADLLTSIARLSQDKVEENDNSSEETTVCQVDVSEDGADEGTDDQADKKILDEAIAEKARIKAEEDAKKRRLEQEGLIHREQERERLDKERLNANVVLLEKVKTTREANRKRKEQEALAAAQEAEKKRLEEERVAEEARIAEEKRIEEEKVTAAKAEVEAAAAAERKAEEERIAAQKKAEEEREAAEASAAEEAKTSDSPEKEESQSSNKRQKRGRYSLRDSEDVEAEEEKQDQEGGDGIRVIITGITVEAKHKKMVESIGGELIEKVDYATTATHAIAGDGKTPLRRTPKLMICVCKTPNILNLDWLTKSSKAKEALDPKNFLLLNDTAAEKTYDFSMKETLKNGKAVRNQRGGLLGGWSVHFCKGVAGKKAPPEHELRLIVAAAGGTFLKSASSRASKEVDAPKLIIITSDPATASQKSDKDVKRLISQGAKIFTTKWFFHSIITQNLSEIEDVPVGAEGDEDNDQKPAAASSPKKGGRKRKAATPSSSSPKRESRRRKR